MTTSMTLADRQKRYEHQTRYVLPKRTYTLVRVDGKAFHSYTKGMARPFDHRLIDAMDNTALRLCREMAGAVLGYVQSDEISVLLTDFAQHGTEPWMGGVLQKITSLSAAIATAEFNRHNVRGDHTPALFDSRVWTVADPNEVVNYFIWRQRDCVKNSITMAAQTVASHRELFGLNANERQELLFSRGINWNDYPDGWKRGRVVYKAPGTVLDGVERRRWADAAAPHFKFEADNWLLRQIPRMPALPEEEEES